MSEFSPTVAAPPSPTQAVEELRAIHALVSDLAGAAPLAGSAPPDLAQRYARAAPIQRQRFDAIASETAAFAATGLSAIIAARATSDRPSGAAAYLAKEMARAIRSLETLLP